MSRLSSATAAATEGQPDAHDPDAPDEVIVYVHGISQHLPGYSEAWHQAITPHLVRPMRRVEVRWSQHVNALAAAESIEQRDEIDLFQKQLEQELERRLERMDETAARRAASARELEAIPCRVERPRSFMLDDFVRYMLIEATRELVLEEFTGGVLVELQAGHKVHIVSHSWGTVVAYEGLRRLDPHVVPGQVSNLFYAGSALSIGVVQANLLGRVGDGRAPLQCRRIVNLDAGGDAIGGPIGDVFFVDREYLGLEPIGCHKIPFTGIAVSFRCAHSSYFVPENVAVNRDIFAGLINQT